MTYKTYNINRNFLIRSVETIIRGLRLWTESREIDTREYHFVFISISSK